MKYILANTNQVKPIQADWRETSSLFRDKVMNLAYVKQNPHKETQALEWLECLCKVHSKVVANTFIEQASGLGSQEMRALGMHDNDKYFPSLSAAEIYKSKRLEAFPVITSSSDKSVEDGWIKSAARDVLREKIGGQRDTVAESKMFSGNAWLKSRPTAFYNTSMNSFIADIEINKGATITPDSELRLHYHSIVAKAVRVGSENNIMLRANLSINTEQLLSLKQMAATSAECKELAKRLLVEIIRDNSSDTVLDISTVDVNPDLITNLIKTGSKHWGQITTDEQVPLVKRDKPLPSEISEVFSNLSKEMVVAEKIKQAAKYIAANTRSKIAQFAINEGLSENTQSPNDLSHLRAGKKLDSQRLFGDLVTLGVAPNTLRKRKVDYKLLLSLFDKSNGGAVDINTTIKYKGFDINKLKASAKLLNIEVDEYQTTTLTPYLSGQSRGPVYDKIQEITSMITDRTSASVKSISSSHLLDHEDLTSSLKNTGVSKTMKTTQQQEF